MFRGRDKLVARDQRADGHRIGHSVKRICTVLGLNRSSYYKWKASSTQRHRRLISDAILVAKVKIVFDVKTSSTVQKSTAAELLCNYDYNTTAPANHKRNSRIVKKLCLRGYTRTQGRHHQACAKSRSVCGPGQAGFHDPNCKHAAPTISPIYRPQTGRILSLIHI